VPRRGIPARWQEADEYRPGCAGCRTASGRPVPARALRCARGIASRGALPRYAPPGVEPLDPAALTCAFYWASVFVLGAAARHSCSLAGSGRIQTRLRQVPDCVRQARPRSRTAVRSGDCFSRSPAPLRPARGQTPGPRGVDVRYIGEDAPALLCSGVGLGFVIRKIQSGVGRRICTRLDLLLIPDAILPHRTHRPQAPTSDFGHSKTQDAGPKWQ